MIVVWALAGFLVALFLFRFAGFFLRAVLWPLLLGLAWLFGWTTGHGRRWLQRRRAGRLNAKEKRQ